MDVMIAHEQLSRLLQTDSSFTIRYQNMEELQIRDDMITNNPGKTYFNNLYNLANAQLSVERNNWLPDINLAYFNGTNKYENAQHYLGYQVGISIPYSSGPVPEKQKLHGSEPGLHKPKQSIIM
jgi:cobalt-zinc-cadmium resistance protein CzcA